MIASWQENYDRNSVLESKDVTLLTKVYVVKAMIFPVVMYSCDSWILKKAESKNWCLWTVVLEKTLESPLDCKVIQPLHPKRNQSWIFIERTDAEAEAPTLWPPDGNSWLTGKDPDAREDWQQKDKRMTEDEMVGWHHWCNGRELGQTQGDGEGQEAWHATAHGLGKSWTWLGDWTTIVYMPIPISQLIPSPYLPSHW